MIPIFIERDPLLWLPAEVLKWSLISRTQAEIKFMEPGELSLKLDRKRSEIAAFYRFAVPEACGYKGRAIYLDASMVALGDIQELYEREMEGKGALARKSDSESWDTSLMLLDCEALKQWRVREWAALINAGLVSFHGTLQGRRSALNHNDFAPLPERWNDGDKCDEETKIIHYARLPTQPWKRPGHPFRGAFLKELKSALDGGAVEEEQVKEEIVRGRIYPGLLEDMEEFVGG